MSDIFRPRTLRLAHGRTLDLGPRAVVMGILNVTPDSFSDGGRFGGSVKAAVEAGLAMVAEGAAIIDIGGESTRPGAAAVEAADELARILPVIEGLAARTDALISVDTYRAETARRAVASGAHLINDVWGAQREPEIAKVAAEMGAALCLMHTGRDREKLRDVIADQHLFLDRSIAIAREAGVQDDALLVDPGFGFAKEVEENLELLRRFRDLHAFGLPIVAGTSRKRFIRAFSGEEGALPDWGTAATSVLMRERGALILRVHEVAGNHAALGVADAVLVGSSR